MRRLTFFSRLLPIALFAFVTACSTPTTASVQQQNPSVIHHIVITGQSLALGTMGSPALSTTQPYQNLMIKDGKLSPLIETDQESIASSMANTISYLTNNGYTSLTTINARNDMSYEGLKKGSGFYNGVLNNVRMANTLARANNRAYEANAVVIIHGESDHVFGNDGNYSKYLVEWQRDYEHDIREITASDKRVIALTDQLSSWSASQNDPRASATSGIPIAQLRASRGDQTAIVLVTPKYFLPYADGLHLSNEGYRWLGEYYGKVYKQTVIDQKQFVALSPRMLFGIGPFVFARFHVPVAPMQIDTTLVPEQANFGFEYTDSTPNSPKISSVHLLPFANFIVFRLDRLPASNVARLRYAYTASPGAGAGSAGAARGNIHDSDATTSLSGKPLFNWMVHFDDPVATLSFNLFGAILLVIALVAGAAYSYIKKRKRG